MRKAIVLSRVSTLQQDLRLPTEEILREVYKEEGGLVIEEGKSGRGGLYSATRPTAIILFMFGTLLGSVG